MYDEQTIIPVVKRQNWSNEKVICLVNDVIEFWDGESGYEGEGFSFESGKVVKIDERRKSILVNQGKEGHNVMVPMFYVKSHRI